MVTYIYLFFACFLCMLLGLVIGVMMMRSKPDGSMVVDTSDPEKDTYSMELNIPIEDIKQKKRLCFDVKIMKNSQVKQSL